MSQYVCLCNISLMLLLWIDLQNAYLEQKKVISVYSTIYCICMLCYACHTRLIYNKLRKVCFWQCFKFLLFAFCHRSLAESSFIIIHFALTLENFFGFVLWNLAEQQTNKKHISEHSFLEYMYQYTTTWSMYEHFIKPQRNFKKEVFCSYDISVTFLCEIFFPILGLLLPLL